MVSPGRQGGGDAAEVAVLEAVGVAFEGDDVGVVDQAVDHRGGHDVVAEDFAPAAEGLVGGDDQRGPFVAAGDELEEQVGRFGFEGDVPDLVDDDQRVAAQAAQLVLEAPVVVGGRRGGRPTREAVANSTRCPAWQARIAMPVARWVLPVPGGPRKTTLSLAATKSRVPRWAIRSRFRPRAWSKSNSSRDLRAGKRAARMRPSPPWDSRAATSRCRHAARNSSWVQDSARARSASRGTASRRRGRFQGAGQERQLRRTASPESVAVVVLGVHHATCPR